jgi:C-terminal processing protease CtpA/Prc
MIFLLIAATLFLLIAATLLALPYIEILELLGSAIERAERADAQQCTLLRQLAQAMKEAQNSATAQEVLRKEIAELKRSLDAAKAQLGELGKSKDQIEEERQRIEEERQRIAEDAAAKGISVEQYKEQLEKEKAKHAQEAEEQTAARKQAEEEFEKKTARYQAQISKAASGKVQNQKGKEGSLGFTFKKVKKTGHFVVSTIKLGGSVEQSGLLKSGDVIVSIDGEGVETLEPMAFAEKMKGPPGEKVRPERLCPCPPRVRAPEGSPRGGRLCWGCAAGGRRT